MEWEWLLESVVLDIHEAQLAEHGGRSGLCDEGLLRSALARPRNLAAYCECASAPELAAAYAFGIARNHPFVDGNKRTAFVAMELFLNLNGWILKASEADCIAAVEAAAAGALPEEDLRKWVGDHSEPA